MKITATRIYDFEESIVASGLPMKENYDEKNFKDQVFVVCNFEDAVTERDIKDRADHFKRANLLSGYPAGSGHNNFLSGILVSMNITATVKFWEQFQRYHFKQLVSSMSTMHRLPAMIENLKTGEASRDEYFHPSVSQVQIDELVKLYNNGATIEELAYSCPMGLLLTARVNTNYLQLKTIYSQRCNHKLQEWHEFCDWVKHLPSAEYFILPRKK